MNKRDIRRAQMAADLLSPPPEIVNATRLRDVVEYLWRKRGLREPREIVAAIRRFRWASVLLQVARDVPGRVKTMVARGHLGAPRLTALDREAIDRVNRIMGAARRRPRGAAVTATAPARRPPPPRQAPARRAGSAGSRYRTPGNRSALNERAP